MCAVPFPSLWTLSVSDQRPFNVGSLNEMFLVSGEYSFVFEYPPILVGSRLDTSVVALNLCASGPCMETLGLVYLNTSDLDTRRLSTSMDTGVNNYSLFFSFSYFNLQAGKPLGGKFSNAH